jgi:hypothetical protein
LIPGRLTTRRAVGTFAVERDNPLIPIKRAKTPGAAAVERARIEQGDGEPMLESFLKKADTTV